MPFDSILTNPEITPLSSDSGQGCISGQAYLVTDGNRKYKLRKCADETSAQAIETLLVQVPTGIFPHFYGRDQNQLLFDYVEGRDMFPDEPLPNIETLGQKIAFLNSVPASEEKDPTDYFMVMVGFLAANNVLDDKTTRATKQTYERLRPLVNLDYCLDYGDLFPFNVRLSNKGEVFIVDEESLKERFRGWSFAKAYLKWFSPEQRAAFEQGYSSMHPIDFFTPELEKLATLVMLVGNTANRFSRGDDRHQINVPKIKALL